MFTIWRKLETPLYVYRHSKANPRFNIPNHCEKPLQMVWQGRAVYDSKCEHSQEISLIESCYVTKTYVNFCRESKEGDLSLPLSSIYTGKLAIILLYNLKQIYKVPNKNENQNKTWNKTKPIRDDDVNEPLIL